MNNSPFYDDNPISDTSEDKLGRAAFAQSLAKAIAEYNNPFTLCIGIYGPWGSGKTSVLNMVMNDIRRNSDGNSPVIVRFNPWSFSSSDQLVYQYFRLLQKELGKSDKGSFAEIIRAIGKYGSAFARFIPNVGEIAGTVLKQGSDAVSDALYAENEDLNGLKDTIADALESQKKRIIVTIDDIDRLPDDQIRQVFQLVAATADFPYTTYLLSFDKDIVVKALDQTQKGSGNLYLDKIVQISVEVPPLTRSQKEELFSDEFGHYLKEEPLLIFQENHWYALSEDIMAMITNLRDIKRLSNASELKFRMIGKNINFADMIALTLLEEKCPPVYQWIQQNRDLLVLTGKYQMDLISGRDQKHKELGEGIKKTISDLSGKTNDSLIFDLVCKLFPRFADYVDASGAMGESLNDLRKYQRIGCESRFNRYFVLSLGKNGVSREEINFILKQADEQEILNFFKDKFCSSEFNREVKYEIDVLIDDVPAERAVILANALLKMGLPESEGDIFFSNTRAVTGLGFQLLRRTGDQQKAADILMNRINNASFEQLEIISEILRLIENEYGLIKDRGGYNDFKLVSKEQLEHLNDAFHEKFNALDQKKNVFLWPLKMSHSLTLLRDLDGKRYREFLNKKFEDKLNILRYAAQFLVGIATGLNDRNQECHIFEISDHPAFLTFEKADQILDQCINDGSIREISDDRLVRLAGYYLVRHRDNHEGHVYEEDAVHLMEDWKRGS